MSKPRSPKPRTPAATRSSCPSRSEQATYRFFSFAFFDLRHRRAARGRLNLTLALHLRPWTEQLVEYIQDAHAMEANVSRMLDSMIGAVGEACR
jgi:hypothetical protein